MNKTAVETSIKVLTIYVWLIALLALGLALKACAVDTPYTKAEAVEDVLTVFCERVADCGIAEGGQSCVNYNMANICPDGFCEFEVVDPDGVVVDCIEQLTVLECSTPLDVPQVCFEVLEFER